MPCFVKQLGRNIVIRNDSLSEWPYEGEDLFEFDREHPGWQGQDLYVRTAHIKGGDPSEWPADLRVREYPKLETTR